MSGVKYRLQRGITLTKLLLTCAIVGVVLVVLMKLAPEYIVYYKIKADVMAIAQEANAKQGATVADIRQSFERRAEIDQITDFRASDLDISKEGDRVIVAFEYERKIHMVKNISVLIEFAGSSAE